MVGIAREYKSQAVTQNWHKNQTSLISTILAHINNHVLESKSQTSV